MSANSRCVTVASNVIGSGSPDWPAALAREEARNDVFPSAPGPARVPVGPALVIPAALISAALIPAARALPPAVPQRLGQHLGAVRPSSRWPVSEVCGEFAGKPLLAVSHGCRGVPPPRASHLLRARAAARSDRFDHSRDRTA
jgi:hypothetical protein